MCSVPFHSIRLRPVLCLSSSLSTWLPSVFFSVEQKKFYSILFFYSFSFFPLSSCSIVFSYRSIRLCPVWLSLSHFFVLLICLSTFLAVWIGSVPFRFVSFRHLCFRWRWMRFVHKHVTNKNIIKSIEVWVWRGFQAIILFQSKHFGNKQPKIHIKRQSGSENRLKIWTFC